MRFDFLAGYRTYVVAVATIVSTLASLFVGDVAAADAAQLIVTALMGMTIRAGITNK